MTLQDPSRFPTTKQPLRAPTPYLERSAFTSVFVSLVIPGLGQMYAGQFKRGLGIAALFFGFVLIGGIVTLGIRGLFGYFWMAVFLFWLWNLYDAYRSARDHNENLRTENAMAIIRQEQNAPRVNPLYISRGPGRASPVPEPDSRRSPLQQGPAEVPARNLPTQMPEQAPLPQNKFCPHCGKTIARTAGRFCQYCGKPLS